MAQVFGVGIDELQKSLANSRYFYGLRRTDNGELYMVKADLLELEDGVQSVSYTHLTLPTNREV